VPEAARGWNGTDNSAEPLKKGRSTNMNIYTHTYIYLTAIAKQQGIRQAKLSADTAKWFPIN